MSMFSEEGGPRLHDDSSCRCGLEGKTWTRKRRRAPDATNIDISVITVIRGVHRVLCEVASQTRRLSLAPPLLFSTENVAGASRELLKTTNDIIRYLDSYYTVFTRSSSQQIVQACNLRHSSVRLYGMIVSVPEHHNCSQVSFVHWMPDDHPCRASTFVQPFWRAWGVHSLQSVDTLGKSMNSRTNNTEHGDFTYRRMYHYHGRHVGS